MDVSGAAFRGAASSRSRPRGAALAEPPSRSRPSRAAPAGPP